MGEGEYDDDDDDDGDDDEEGEEVRGKKTASKSWTSLYRVNQTEWLLQL